MLLFLTKRSGSFTCLISCQLKNCYQRQAQFILCSFYDKILVINSRYNKAIGHVTFKNWITALV